MDIITPLLLIIGGILAISRLIVANKPDAKPLIDKLVPYQAGIGIGLLVFGFYELLRSFGSIFDMLRIAPLFGLAVLGMIVSAILLGFLFGMPQIAKWLPGDGAAEQKGMGLSKKLAPFQVILGLVGLGSALVFLLYRFHILRLYW